MMYDMQLWCYRGIANLPYVVHAHVIVTFDIDIVTLCDIMWLLLNIMVFNDI